MNNINRKRLVKKLSKNLSVATPLVVAAFSMSQVATAQSSNCPAGSTYTLGICLVTTPSQAQPEAQTTSSLYRSTSYQTNGEAEAGSAYKAQPEATGEAEAGSAYKAQPEATGEAEAGSAYKAKGEAESTGAVYQPTSYQANSEAEASGGVIASGTWTKKSFKTKGSWTLSAENGVTTISLDDDFSTRNAPDLKIFLSPLSAASVKNKTAVPGSLLIAPLQSNKGRQSYIVPAGTDLSKYKSVIIHCEAYTKLWSAADL